MRAVDDILAALDAIDLSKFATEQKWDQKGRGAFDARDLIAKAHAATNDLRAVAARAEAAERRADDLQTQLSAAADRIRELEIRSHAPGVSVIAVDPRGGGVPDLGADPESADLACRVNRLCRECFADPCECASK